MFRLLLLLLTVLVPALSQAAIETKTIEYRQGDTRLVGYLAYPKDAKAPLPGVLVVHEWKGLNDYARRRAEQLAELGLSLIHILTLKNDIFRRYLPPSHHLTDLGHRLMFSLFYPSLRTLLFQMDPETAHHWTLKLLRSACLLYTSRCV